MSTRIPGQTGGDRRLMGIAIVGDPSGATPILKFNSTTNVFEWVAQAGGESNTASNVGTGVGKIFKQKAGVDLEFKSVKGNAPISITNDTNEVTIDSSAEANTVSNVGGEKEVFKAKTGVDMALRTLKAGTNITLTQNANDILIDATGGASLSEVEFLQGKDASGDLQNLTGGSTNATGAIITVTPPVSTTTVIVAANMITSCNASGEYSVEVQVNAVVIGSHDTRGIGAAQGVAILELPFRTVKGKQLIGDGTKTIILTVASQANSEHVEGNMELYDL